MSKLPIEGKLEEINNGPFYPVRFSAVPRVGELIELYSFIDANSKLSPPKKFYEVVQVVHNMYDVIEHDERLANGMHFVTVIVKPTDRNRFSK